MNLSHSLLLVGASALAGAVNSVAGGGTLLTFPALLAAGQTAIIANATSTVALWPGQLSSLWGYRKEIGQTRAAAVPMVLLGLAGGILGAFLLLQTPSKTFDKLVPFLVLTATVLFMLQEPLARWLKARAAKTAAGEPANQTAVPTDAEAADTPETYPTPYAKSETEKSLFRRVTPGIALLLFLIAVYGGYFGAGIGILTLATLGFLGFRNIHQMNGVKNIYTLFINGVAAVIFIARSLVDWHIAALMAAGAILGGYAGADIARRIGQRNVRRVVIGIGLLLTLSLLFKTH